MAAPTETYIDPAEGASAGNDHGGNAFVDGSFANATNTLTKVGAFTAATCQAGDKIYLDDNGSGEVTAGLYTIQTRTDNDNVVLTADIRSGVPDPTDVRCDQHTGTVALPWATVQHALDFTTRDGTNGDRFNVKAGTDDVLAAALDFSTYGAPTATAPWICQGYTSAAGDGGIGGISGNGSYGMVASATLDNLCFVDMHLHNSGSNPILFLDNYCQLHNCELNNTTGNGFNADNHPIVMNCYFHDIGGNGIDLTSGQGLIAFNTFENGASNKFDITVESDNYGSTIVFNQFDLDSSSIAIELGALTSCAMFNSIYCNAGTGTGIDIDGKGNIVFSNIIEGFSGVGGKGIVVASAGRLLQYGYNAFYNNTTDETLTGTVVNNLGNNQSLSASPFIDAANDDFRLKPNVQTLAWLTDNFPNLSVRGYYDIGALQRKSQILMHPGMAGGTRG